MKCPICDKEFQPEESPNALPFCSMRCKMIDAKRWLGEEYSFESLTIPDPDEELPPEDA